MPNETERLMKKVTEEMREHEFDSEEDVDAFLQQFTETFSGDTLKNSKEDMAFGEYELGCAMMNSGDPGDEREAIKHLKKAVKLDPPFYDAQLELLCQEEDPFKLIKKIKALEEEAEVGCLKAARMQKDKVFGQAWYIIELRPLMRIKHRLTLHYLEHGMFGLAKDKLEEMLQWNTNDNQGVRSILIGLYAFFEDEQAALQLYKKYHEEPSAWNLLSLAALYYKLGDEKVCRSYLKKLDKAIPTAFETFCEIVFESEDHEHSDLPYYRPGSSEEFEFALTDLDYLFISNNAFMTYFIIYAVKAQEKHLAAEMKKAATEKKAKKAKNQKGSSTTSRRKGK